MYSQCNSGCKEITGYIWVRFGQTERAKDQKSDALN